MGATRYKRILSGRAKNTSQSHLNGLKATPIVIEKLASFVDNLSVDLGYPCSHRRMKKYLTDPNFRRRAICTDSIQLILQT